MKQYLKIIKLALLFMFSLVNAIDAAQTLTFIQMGIEVNIFTMDYPQIWLALKLIFTFGLPIGLYRLDVYLSTKPKEGFLSTLRWFVLLTYASVFLADILYLQLIIRNMTFLGRLFTLSP